MGRTVWQKCADHLQDEMSSQQFDTCIKPLQVRETDSRVELLAPNRYVRDQVRVAHLRRINELLNQQGNAVEVEVEVGDIEPPPREPLRADGTKRKRNNKKSKEKSRKAYKSSSDKRALNDDFTFDTFVEGKSNELAKAAAFQVASKSGQSYNPLLLYGGVGLGKTHLMQAVGNQIMALSPDTNLVYLHSQGFVRDMVDGLREGRMPEFVRFYHSVDVLLIDDIQFFARTVHAQEEFFHVFNRLIEHGHQMVFTSDRYPREIDGLEERLKSRFVWGLTVEVEPPELETRVAILMKKAEAEQMRLDPAVAFFIAERIRSNVRELEGALRRVIANARFTGSSVTIDQVKRSLRDLFAIQERLISIDNIQGTVAEYYNIKKSDILSKRRNRNVVRPRQMAMRLARELTEHSLPEIGEAFGGRDHTTVLHACQRIKELIREGVGGLEEDYRNLSRLLSS